MLSFYVHIDFYNFDFGSGNWLWDNFQYHKRESIRPNGFAKKKKKVLQRYHFRGNRTQRKNTGSMILEQNEDLNFQHTITFQLERVRSHWKD